MRHQSLSFSNRCTPNTIKVCLKSPSLKCSYVMCSLFRSQPSQLLSLSAVFPVRKLFAFNPPSNDLTFFIHHNDAPEKARKACVTCRETEARSDLTKVTQLASKASRYRKTTFSRADPAARLSWKSATVLWLSEYTTQEHYPFLNSHLNTD